MTISPSVATFPPMKPLYTPDYWENPETFNKLKNEVPWIRVTETRQECFMAPSRTEYTYGEGKGVRTYTSVPYHDEVLEIQGAINKNYDFNVCFLNRYDAASQHLGWHADDSPGMDHEHPIIVISFGEPREIWWREKGYRGVIPANQRQLLGHGSLFYMPPGFQLQYQHRIPKGDKPMGCRISLTYRRYINER